MGPRKHLLLIKSRPAVYHERERNYLKMLLPGALIVGLNLEGSPRQKDCIVQVLQVEQHARQVVQNLGVVRRHRQGAPKISFHTSCR